MGEYRVIWRILKKRAEARHIDGQKYLIILFSFQIICRFTNDTLAI